MTDSLSSNESLEEIIEHKFIIKTDKIIFHFYNKQILIILRMFYHILLYFTTSVSISSLILPKLGYGQNKTG